MHPLIPFFERIEIPLGPISIHGFGIFVAIGFITGTWLATRKAQQDGLDPDIINRLVTWIIVGVFVGGHLGHLLFYYPEDLANDPELFGQFFSAFAHGRLPTVDEIPQLLRVWQGLSSYGGFIATVALCVWFFRRENRRVSEHNAVLQRENKPLKLPVQVLPYGDTVMYGMTLGWFFGRTGCFSAHDHPGTETEFWLGVMGICPSQSSSIACHDLGLYEAIWSLCMFVLFVYLNKKPRFQGFYMGLMAVCYGPFRLFLDVFRHPETDTRYLGLTPAQYLSVVVTLVGFWLLYTYKDTTPIRTLIANTKAASAKKT